MFDVCTADDGAVVLSGRCHAGHVDILRVALDALRGDCIIDCHRLEYISSAGLGVLLGLRRRVGDAGGRVRIRGLNPHLAEVFRITGFDRLFDIE